MKTPKILILLLILPMLISANLHKFYVSVTEVEYVKDKQQVQIISRIFIDDFEKVLRDRYDEHLSLDSKKETSEALSYIQLYLKEKILIKINGKPIDFKFIGKEYDNDIMFCYLEIDAVKDIKSFEITNRLLFDKFEDQQNIVKFKINSSNKNIILIPQNDKGLLNF